VAEAIANFFRSTEGSGNPVSSHYIVDRAGVVVQCVAEADGAWCNGYISDGHDPWWTSDINPNNVTISIEHVKATIDNSDGLTDAQKQAAFHLIYDICARNNIPMRKADASGGITGHYSIDPQNRSRCPGNYPWDELFAFLTAQENSLMLSYQDVASYFVEVSPTRWRCRKTGFDVADGILTFYRSCPFLGLPLTPELYPVPGVAVQQFERGIINWDPRRQLDNPQAAKGPAYLAKIKAP
jgi:hypothetical protein